MSGDKALSSLPLADLTNVGAVNEIYLTQDGNSRRVTAEMFCDLAGGYFNARGFGVTADGSTDDTAALQSAIDAAIAHAVPLFLPMGTMKISSALTVSSSLTMIGWGRERTVFSLASATQNGISITANDTGPVNFQGFGMTASVTHTAGSGILVDSSGSHINYESRFVDLRFSNLFHGIDFERAAYFVLDGCAFENCRDYALIVKDVADPDGGDSFISNCLFEYFNTVTSANILLYWESSGGLKISNTKFNGGFRSMYFNLASGAGTGSIVVAGNSIESFTDAGIFIGAATGSPVLGTLSKFVITGNEIGAFANGTCVKVFAASTPTWFKGLTIAGNVIATDISGTGTSGKGIDLDFCQNVTIAGNTIRGEGSAGTTVGINLGSNVSGVSKGINAITGFATDIVDASTSAQFEVIAGAVRTLDGYSARSGFPHLLLDEVSAKGFLAFVLSGVLTWQRRATDFGAAEATLFSMNINTGLAEFFNPVKLMVTTVAGLPAAATAGSGARAFVTDANAPTFGNTVTGGSTTKIPVYSDGTNWKVG